jgi:hypothetical protein
MKTSMIVFVVFALLAGGALALMNNACKTSRHSWCAPLEAAATTPPDG